MKVIRIFNMRKYFLSILLLIVVCFSFSCKLFETPIKTYENELTFSMVEEYKQYFPYELPTFTLKFDGKINTTENRTGPYEVVFTENDDFKVSNILNQLFVEYEDSLIVYQLSVDNEPETWMNTYKDGEHEKEYIKVLDNKTQDLQEVYLKEYGRRESFLWKQK